MASALENKPIRVASIGLGRWGNTIADAIQASQKLQLSSCFTRTKEKREAFADKFKCDADESLDALLNRDDVDAVVITAPNNRHCEIAEAAAAHNKHVFVDKPIALEISDAEAMINACAQAGVKLAVGASSRFLRGHRVCRQLIEDGVLGNLALVETNYSNARGLHYTPDNWQWYAKGSPGGPLMQVAIHQIDNFLYLFGKIKRVSAEFRKVMTKSEIPDVCVLWLEFESGLLGTLGTSFISPQAPSGRYTYFINAYGHKANFYHDRWDGISLFQSGQEDKVPVEYEEYPGFDYLTCELDDFAGAIINDRSPEVSGEDGLHVLKVVKAAMLSAELKRPVELKEL
ncbi:Gfo/Idh/MocA family protein [Pseudomonadota bacterium]